MNSSMHQIFELWITESPTYKMLNWIRIRQWTNNKRILHSLINEELRQIFDTGLEIFSTNVIFPVQFSGLVQIFNFLCEYVIQMKKKLNYLVKPHERFPFGFLFLVNGFFRKKSNFQHCQKLLFQIHDFSCNLACFILESLHQNVLNVFLQIFSEEFLDLTCFYHKN